MAPESHDYHPHDAVGAAINGALITGAAGALVSAVQNSLSRRNIGAWGVFTKTGSTIAVFTAMGGTYEFARYACANLREKDDSLNAAFGGFLAGGLIGVKLGTTPAVLGYGTLAAVVLGAFDFTGGTLKGFKKDPELDEFERKQALRANRRRPIEETISELGEGRGIHAPGYAERRRERIKAKYGIDVPVESS